MRIPEIAKSADRYGPFEKYQYLFADREAIVCLPEKLQDHAPFVWRTEFFSAFDMADQEMLRRGYAVVHYRIPDLFGCPIAVAQMHDFFQHLVCSWEFQPKCIPFGFSRGGLYAVNYAAAYPDTVAALYLDAPVLDLKSWPAGLGTGVGSANDTELMYACYGLNRQTIGSFTGNPLDSVKTLMAHRIPVVLVAGELDRDVPYAENGAILARQYENGGLSQLLRVILKPDCAHHPHSLPDPMPICDGLIAMINAGKI